MEKNNLLNKSLRYLSRVALSGFILSNFLTSCQKENAIPLDEQFQYKIEKSNKVWDVPENFIKPSISVLDFDGDGNLDLVASNELDNKIYSFPKSLDGVFSENSSSSYTPTKRFLLTDFTAKKFGEQMQSFLVNKIGEIYKQKMNLEQNSLNFNRDYILKIPQTEDNDGMISSYDFTHDGTLDLLVAKIDKNQKLINVYKYESKELPNGEAEGSFLYDNKPYFQLPEGTKSFAVGDVDENGSLDILVLEKDNSVYLYNLIKN